MNTDRTNDLLRFLPVRKTPIWGTEDWLISAHPHGETPLLLADGSAGPSLRELFDDRVSELAGRWCAEENKRTLDQVQLVLERWHERGARTAEDVEALLKPVRDQQRLLKTLWHLWGRRERLAKQDYELTAKWQQTWGFSADMILAVAPWATEADKPMPYLDGVLQNLHDKGITTYEAAKAEHEKRRQEGVRPAGKARENPALQYDQRSYETDTREMPEWLKQNLAGEAHHAQ